MRKTTTILDGRYVIERDGSTGFTVRTKYTTYIKDPDDSEEFLKKDNYITTYHSNFKSCLIFIAKDCGSDSKDIDEAISIIERMEKEIMKLNNN